MNEFLKEDHYSYGDFCWIDFNNKDNVEKLKPYEVAELLYLGHRFEPVTSPFFTILENKYAYLAHDDGYFCRLYCNKMDDFKEILSNKIIKAVSASKRR